MATNDTVWYFEFMDRVERSLLEFFNGGELQVTSLRGAWGIGKSYFWREFVRSHRDDLSVRGYSYVSLFGVDSIQQLKSQCVAKAEFFQGPDVVNSVKEAVKPWISLVKGAKIPYLDSGGVVESFFDTPLLNKFLICFDDLERKESGITVSAFLGLISQLKEEKDCRIIVIYNDEKIDEGVRKELAEYREKVIDLDLTYEPSVLDNLRLIWSEPPSDVTAVFERLSLKNIRVMQRVEWALGHFSEALSISFPHVHQVLRSKVIALTIAHYSFADVLTVEELANTLVYSVFDSDSEEDKMKAEIIEDLGYMPSDCDRLVINYLNNGYIDVREEREFLEGLEERYRRGDINEQHRSIWDETRAGFVLTQDELVPKHVSFLKAHWKDLSIFDLVYAVRFLEELDPTCGAEELVELAVEEFARAPSRDQLEDLSFRELPDDVREKIALKLSENQRQIPIGEIMQDLGNPDGYNTKMLPHLEKYSEAELEGWLIEQQEDRPLRLLRRFYERFRHAPEAEGVVQKFDRIVGRIRERSKLDAVRVKNLIERD